MVEWEYRMVWLFSSLGPKNKASVPAYTRNSTTLTLYLYSAAGWPDHLFSDWLMQATMQSPAGSSGLHLTSTSFHGLRGCSAKKKRRSSELRSFRRWTWLWSWCCDHYLGMKGRHPCKTWTPVGKVSLHLRMPADCCHTKLVGWCTGVTAYDIRLTMEAVSCRWTQLAQPLKGWAASGTLVIQVEGADADNMRAITCGFCLWLGTRLKEFFVVERACSLPILAARFISKANLNNGIAHWRLFVLLHSLVPATCLMQAPGHGLARTAQRRKISWLVSTNRPFSLKTSFSRLRMAPASCKIRIWTLMLETNAGRDSHRWDHAYVQHRLPPNPPGGEVWTH